MHQRLELEGEVPRNAGRSHLNEGTETAGELPFDVVGSKVKPDPEPVFR